MLEYDELLSMYRKRGYLIDDLRESILKLEDELGTAEHKIHTELEPRIKSEEKQYDTHVLNGGNDVCFQFGMSGKCNEDCPGYGSKPECTD